MNDNLEQLNQTAENLSATIYPYPPHKEQTMGKLASFLAGVITGAVALGVTACLVERNNNHEEDTANSSCEDEQEENTSSAAEEQSSNPVENPVTTV